jgi:hypothetical protein
VGFVLRLIANMMAVKVTLAAVPYGGQPTAKKQNK